MSKISFNTVADDFTAQLRTAEAAFAQNPADAAPLEKLGQKLSRRYRDQGKDILDRTSTAASFANLGGTMERMGEAINMLEGATPENAAAAMDNFAKTVTTELTSAVTNIGENRAQVVYFRDNNREIRTDAEALLMLVEKCVARDDVARDKINAVKSSVADLVENTGFQDPLLEGMQLACDEQIGKVKSLMTTMEGQRQQFHDTADKARALRETVDICRNGLKSPVTARKKPVTFRAPQT